MLEIRLIVRAAHLLAAAAWVGGSFFYLVVALPALRNGGPAPGVGAQMAGLFRRMVTICTGVLLLTGAYLTFDRLTTTTLGWPYLAVLALKIALAFYLGQSNIRRLAKRATRLSKAAPQLMLSLGILVFVLGALLNILFETSTTH
ncbi:MAG TPA: hypothetical protein VKR83_04550 [Ktedonobacteraceae bacterium]|nr:hypothetical protein [Ktedonobacteraceae bacterium]